MLRVNEIFGPTIQGEGPAAGRLCSFLRLSGCNLDCRWCDTPYTWRWQHLKWPDQDPDGPTFDIAAETHGMTAEVVVDQLTAIGGRLVVVSGGEPLTQQAALADTVGLLPEEVDVHVETNGTLTPSTDLQSAVDLFVVSPKLSHSGVDFDKAIRHDRLAVFAEISEYDRAVVKFVVRSRLDVLNAVVLAQQVGFPLRHVWVMPEARTRAELADRFPDVAGWAVDAGVNVSTRMHIAAWDDRRAV